MQGFLRQIPSSITLINVPVVYKARDVMILMWANPLQGPLDGVGPEIETFLCPEVTTSEVSAIWDKKSRLPQAKGSKGNRLPFATAPQVI